MVCSWYNTGGVSQGKCRHESAFARPGCGREEGGEEDRKLYNGMEDMLIYLFMNSLDKYLLHIGCLPDAKHWRDSTRTLCFAFKEMKNYVLVLSIGTETCRMSFKTCSSTFSYGSPWVGFLTSWSQDLVFCRMKMIWTCFIDCEEVTGDGVWW